MAMSAGIKTALKQFAAIGEALWSICAKVAGVSFPAVTALLGTAKASSGSGNAPDTARARPGVSGEGMSELGNSADFPGADMETMSPLTTAIDPHAAADDLLMREAPQARKPIADYLANEVESTLEEWMKIGVIVKGTHAHLHARELAARLRRAGTWEYLDSELADLPAKVKGFLSLGDRGHAA